MMSTAHVLPVPSPAAVLTKAVCSAADRLGLKNRELALVVGTSEASISRLSSGREVDPETKEGELALMFLRLFRSLDALVGGDDQKARSWLEAPNSHLGNAVPRERILTVEGLVDVVQYLDAMRGRI